MRNAACCEPKWLSHAAGQHRDHALKDDIPQSAVGADCPQGHIWAGGFAKGELRSELYADVPDALTVWRSMGIRTYIYSSGSRCRPRSQSRPPCEGQSRLWTSVRARALCTQSRPSGFRHGNKALRHRFELAGWAEAHTTRLFSL